jgi:hypothetical protein
MNRGEQDVYLYRSLETWGSSSSTTVRDVGIRLAGLRLLGKHHIREGMQVCIVYAGNQNRWDSQERMWEILKVLKSYGAAARMMLPDLRALAQTCRDDKELSPDDRAKKLAAVEDAIQFIEMAKDGPQLRSIAPLLRKANAGEPRK